MKTTLMLAAALLLVPIVQSDAVSPNSITITAKKMSAGSRDGGTVGPVKSVKRTQEDIYYEFNLRSMEPDVLSPVTVRWVILVSTLKGSLREASKGSAQVSLTPARVEIVETPLFTLREQEGPKGAKFEAEVFGWGVRVMGPDGSLISECIQPEKHRKQVEAAF